MALTLDATATAPWPATATAVLTGATVTTGYRVNVWGEVFDALTCEVVYEANAAPAGTCTITMPEVVDPSGLDIYYQATLMSRATVLVEGSYTIEGVTTWGTIFYGALTDTTTVDGIVTLTVESIETHFDIPAKATYHVAAGATSLADVLTGLGNTQTYIWRVCDLNVSGLSAPTAGQLTVFRTQELQAGDNFDSWFRGLADCLGQWIRGDYRKTTGNMWAYRLTPRPTAWVPLDITAMVTRRSWRQSLDKYWNVLVLTATWITGNTTGTAKRVYLGTDATDEEMPLVAKEVAVNLKPAGGVLSATEPTALAWLAASAPSPFTYTQELRAVWWLDIGMRVTHPGFRGTPVTTTITRVAFHAHTGTMTIESN